MRRALLHWGLRLAVQLRVILDAWERNMLNALLETEVGSAELQLRDGDWRWEPDEDEW